MAGFSPYLTREYLSSVPQAFVNVDKVAASEDGSFQVCIYVNGTLSRDIIVILQTVDGSALGKLTPQRTMCLLMLNPVTVAGFDYIHVGYELEFVVSGWSVQCVRIQLVNDSLAEAGEGLPLS